MIVQGVLEILVLHVVVEIVIEAGIIDYVHVNVAMGLRKGFPEERVVLLSICSIGRVKIL